MRKNILITGASSGLGHGMAVEFAKQGCNLALCEATGLSGHHEGNARRLCSARDRRFIALWSTVITRISVSFVIISSFLMTVSLMTSQSTPESNIP